MASFIVYLPELRSAFQVFSALYSVSSLICRASNTKVSGRDTKELPNGQPSKTFCPLLPSGAALRTPVNLAMLTPARDNPRATLFNPHLLSPILLGSRLVCLPAGYAHRRKSHRGTIRHRYRTKPFLTGAHSPGGGKTSILEIWT